MGKKLSIIILTALTLGTTWAIRGQFGHEQGAAWAAGPACILLVYFSSIPHWSKIGIKASFLGAIGWGLGGMMSYGVVVGYGRSTDWINSSYGLLMLAVIGGLYGLLGGGLFGLGIEEGNSEKKVAWHQLLVEMTAGGIIFYYFIIEQLGIAMTPPRSEAWAVCAGAGLSLLYFLIRNNYTGALRTALFSSIGAGFGFAFGDFLLVMGTLSGVNFNFWNVMEYSLGFFGGLGMSYGLLTGFKLPNMELKPSAKPVNLRVKWSLIGLLGLIPLIVFHQSFLEKTSFPDFSEFDLSNSEERAFLVLVVAFVLWCILQVAGYRNYQKLKSKSLSYDKFLYRIGMTLFLVYMLYSLLITGAFFTVARIEQYLYVLNFLLIAFWASKVKVMEAEADLPIFSPKKVSAFAILIILFLGIIAAFSHGPLQGAQERF